VIRVLLLQPSSVLVTSTLEALKVDESPSDAAPEEDPFAESDEWIAAEVRQLFRAFSAFDPKAVEICQFYFYDYLAKTLGRHMRKVAPWDTKGFWQDGFNDTEWHIDVPVKVWLTGWLVCVLSADEGSDRAEEWWREPFQVEVRLDSMTGQFQGSRYCVGDRRPRQEKAIIGLEIGGEKRIELEPAFRIVDMKLPPPSPAGGWVMRVVRGDFSAE
jgi:hypothetical protein